MISFGLVPFQTSQGKNSNFVLENLSWVLSSSPPSPLPHSPNLFLIVFKMKLSNFMRICSEKA
jgi:hypothetical protein